MVNETAEVTTVAEEATPVVPEEKVEEVAAEPVPEPAAEGEKQAEAPETTA